MVRIRQGGRANFCLAWRADASLLRLAIPVANFVIDRRIDGRPLGSTELAEPVAAHGAVARATSAASFFIFQLRVALGLDDPFGYFLLLIFVTAVVFVRLNYPFVANPLPKDCARMS